MTPDSEEEPIQIWSYSAKSDRFEKSFEFGETEHKRSITDVSWAPLVGRDHHIILSASEDKVLTIWKAEIEYDEDDEAKKTNLTAVKQIGSKQAVSNQ